MKRLGTIAAAFAFFALLGCATVYRLNARTYQLEGNSQVPAAEGTVDVKVGENVNTRLHVHVKHLAQPAKIAPGATAFVVWIKAPQERAQNIGAMTVNTDLSGDLYTVTSQPQFELSITPERSATAQEPTGMVVLHTTISRG